MAGKRGLVQTVGTTEDPIIVSLQTYQPDIAVFIASDRSLPVAEKAVSVAKPPKYRIIKLDDPDDMSEAYRVGRQAYRLFREEGVEELFADPTGGTKVMAAGLVLALAGLNFTFIYVTGPRDKIGRVIPGQEEIRTMVDPTERFHVFERRAFVQAWNGWRMQSASQILEGILQSDNELEKTERKYYQALHQIARGMYEWDRFHHGKAARLLRTHLPPALEVAREWGRADIVSLLENLEGRIETLAAINQASNSSRPTFAVLEDLLANAERRADAGRYDDALARLYRALELALEAHFNERYDLKLRHSDQWPAELRRLIGHSTKRMGLFELIDVGKQLAEHFNEKDSLPLRLHRRKKELRQLVEDRHRSILAHGVHPIDQADYQKMFAFLRALGLKPAEPWPKWREA